MGKPSFKSTTHKKKIICIQCNVKFLVLFWKVHWFWTRCENIFAIILGVKINSPWVCVTMVVSTSLDYLYQCDITHERITFIA
jgi:hypothetical protein